ncbi:MAG: DUF4868 domain-containing protein [Pseudomonadales bacterium]
MLENFQLAAIVKQGGSIRLLRIPLHRALQDELAASWFAQYEAFVNDVDEIDFNAGYQPEAHERFRLQGYVLPNWLAEETSHSVAELDAVTADDALLESTRGIAGFARNADGEELMLFQNFSRSHVIRPGRFLFLQNNTYETTQRAGLTLDSRLSAVLLRASNTLLFRNFRTVNTFLPLAQFYEEASEHEIRDILNHERLAPEDVDALAAHSNQWFRKRYAMLRDSGVLDNYTAHEIRDHSADYEVDIRVVDERIVFPADRREAKRLLQFLNEEIFRGAITETLYETNSKREAD